MNTEYTFNLGNQSIKSIYTDNQIDESKLGSAIKSLLFRNHEVTIQSKVHLETLKYFLEYVMNGNLEGYDVNNITEFIILSEEIGKDYVQNTYKSLMNKFSKETLLLDKIINKECESKDKEIIENQISQNLHHYIHQNPEKIRKIQITSLINIFSNPNRSLPNHDIAYDFIVNSAEIEKNQQFYVLIGCLDGTEMSKDKMEDAFYKQDIHQGFVPKIPAHFFSTLKDKTDDACQKFSQLEEEQENQFNFLQNQIELLKAEILALKSQRPNKLTKYNEAPQNENEYEEEEEDDKDRSTEEIEEEEECDKNHSAVEIEEEEECDKDHSAVEIEEEDNKMKKVEPKDEKNGNSNQSFFNFHHFPQQTGRKKTGDDLRDEMAREKLLAKVAEIRKKERAMREKNHPTQPSDKQPDKTKVVRRGGLLPGPKRRIPNRWKNQKVSFG